MSSLVACLALLALLAGLPAWADHGGDRAATVAIAPLPGAGGSEDQHALLIEDAGPSRPLVVLVPDHVGADYRSWFHADALLHAGLDVLVLEPAAERPAGMLDALFAALLAAQEGKVGGHQRGQVGLFGFGPAGEAAMLAALEPKAAARAGEDGPRFAGHVALYPTCGPDLAAALLREPPEPPTAAPVLIVQPWAEAGPSQGGWNCSGLTADAAEGRDERVTLRRYDWTGYGFDLEPNSPRHVLPHPTGEGALIAVPDPGAAELARRDIAAFLRGALGRR